ncbi:PAS domain S-box protein [Paenibacillus pinistramenti]|uniref:PAS domain S-box protein n=1 Tax=Paenibacillus pinistramenti TaxID=1768003 RepID=UPI001108E1B5|nr:PAS domain S-box protein [Paenibacillus pinistramenti]
MSTEHEIIDMAYFDQIFKHAPTGMALLTDRGLFLRANPAFCQLLGYSEAELQHKSFTHITHPDDVPDSLSPFMLILQGKEEIYRTEKRYIHKNGQTIWASSVISLLIRPEGTPYFAAQIIDITALKLAEARLLEKEHLLRQKELLYQSVADNSYDFITRHSPDGTFKDVSASCYEVLGYRKEEMVGQPGEAFLHPEEWAYIEQKHFTLLETGSRYNLTYRLRRKDGQYLWVESTSFVVPDPDTGQIQEVVVVSRNITENIQTLNMLKESQGRYQMIADHAREIIVFTDRNGFIQYVSPAVTGLLGYEVSEVLGTRIFDYWHPQERLPKQKKIRSGSWAVNASINRVRHKEGHYIYIETTFQPVQNEEGAVTQILCISRDFSERKQAEDELRAANERLESFIVNHADAVWIMDREGIVKQINPAFQRLFQWSPPEVLARQLPIIPESCRTRMKILQNEVLSGRSIAGYESTWERKDGQPVEVSATFFPIRDNAGKIVGIAGSAQDIRGKKQSEKKLKAAKEQLESYLHHNIDPVLILDTECRVLRINPAFEKTFGWTGSELVGTIAFDLPHIPKDAGQAELVSFEEIKPFTIATNRQQKDGTIIPVQISVFPLLDEPGSHNGWALNLRDMTAHKQAEQLLINSEKLSIAGQLAAGIAHEIRNPITAIKGFVQLMNSGLPEKQLYYDIMASEIDRIEMILSELLILAKPQAAQFEPADIRQLLRQVITLLDSQANMNNVQIVTEFEPGEACILCDKNQLKQVCINFIKNAIEAMPDGGVVTIQLGRSSSGSHYLLRFIDEGVGIPAHLLERLGHPFYTTKEKGTGLGFMVSKKIIENHNGTVTIHSTENVGTTIEISLPFIQVIV